MRVGRFSTAVRTATAHIHDRLGIRRPLQPPDLLAVVAGIRGDRFALVLGWRRAPDVARAAVVEHPGDGATARGGDELFGERGGERLLEGKGRLLSPQCGRGECK